MPFSSVQVNVIWVSLISEADRIGLDKAASAIEERESTEIVIIARNKILFFINLLQKYFFPFVYLFIVKFFSSSCLLAIVIFFSSVNKKACFFNYRRNRL